MDNVTALNISALHSAPPAPGVPDGPLHIERLMALAFFPGRAPRSSEYREGCQASLEYHILGRRMPLSYRAGCCEADAWFAGAEEGHAIWRRKSEATDPCGEQSASSQVCT
jgi:hypothetical protein